ncbi:DUF4365 domain-containing protein [Roseibium sp. M-1]
MRETQQDRTIRNGNEWAYTHPMDKRFTDSQVLGELGETAVKKIVLETGFIYENRGRFEAGTDGLIELRDRRNGAPLGKLLGVQVKSSADGKYVRETDQQFEYVIKAADLAYWRKYNIPVIIARKGADKNAQ